MMSKPADSAQKPNASKTTASRDGASATSGSQGPQSSRGLQGAQGTLGLRRRSRELALQLLFQSEFGFKGAPLEMLKRFAKDFSINDETLDYASSLIEGIFENREAIDGLIQNHSSHWKVARMALVDINVMRIAVFEMRFLTPAVPSAVSINEAIEIAKKYGSTDSGSFVNGILDKLVEA